MKKKTYAIYTVMLLFFVVAAGFIGYELGKSKGSIFAQNTNIKSSTKITSNGASRKNDGKRKTTDNSSIAVVNLDEGVKLNGKTVYYSQKISEFPTSDFYYTSLNEAQKGVSNGSVGAYIIIPAKFSSNVVTLNERPIASKLDYKISKKLSGKKQLRALYDIVNFGNSVNNNLSYMYLESTLSEFHDAQDSAKTVLDNDSKDLEAINKISSNDLVTMVQIPEMKQVEGTPKQLDVSQCTTENNNTLKDINDNYQKIISDAQQKLENVQLQKNVLETTLKELSKEVENIPTSQGENQDVLPIPGIPQSGDNNDGDLTAEAKSNLNKRLLELLKQSEEDRKDLQTKVDQLSSQVDSLEQNIIRQSEGGKLSAASVPSLVSSQSDVSDATTYKQLVSITYNANELSKPNNNIPKFNVEITQDAKKKQNVAVTQALMEKLIGYLGDDKLKEFATVCDGDNTFKESLSGTDYKNSYDFILSLRKQGTDMLWSNATIGYSGSTLSDLSNFAREQAKVESPDDQTKKDKTINPVLKNSLDQVKTTTSQLKESSNNYFKLDINTLQSQIEQEVIDPLARKAQKTEKDYKVVSQKQQEAINKFSESLKDNQIVPQTMFDKVSISKLENTQNKLLDLLNESNQSYGDYISKIYETSMNNQQTVFDSLSKADEDSKQQIESGLAETKRIKNQDSQCNQKLMNGFIAKLPYTRLGSIENENVYQYMANPVTLEGNINEIDASRLSSVGGITEKKVGAKVNKTVPTPPKAAWYLLIILIVLLAIGIMTMTVINRSQQENEDWE